VAVVGIAGFLLGAPSALNQQIFLNQDFVWSVGLMLSGGFFAFAAIRYGVRRFREEFIDTADSDIRVGRWWDAAIYLVLVEAVVLILWWIYQAADWTDLRATFTLFSPFNVGTLLIQSAIAIGAFVLLNNWFVRKTLDAPGGEVSVALEDARSMT
jgi:NSS family neurotransmitter:Na+ symporter